MGIFKRISKAIEKGKIEAHQEAKASEAREAAKEAHNQWVDKRIAEHEKYAEQNRQEGDMQAMQKRLDKANRLRDSYK